MEQLKNMLKKVVAFRNKDILEIRRKKRDICLENSKTSRVIPDGYLSSEEFWKEADKRIIRVCKHYGVLY